MPDPTPLSQRVAEALPCVCNADETGRHEGGPFACPARYRPAVLALVEQAVAEEREACAKVADAGVGPGWPDGMNKIEHFQSCTAHDIAKAIRARKGTP